MTPDRRRDRRQPPRPQRAAPSRRAARRLIEHEEEGSARPPTRAPHQPVDTRQEPAPRFTEEEFREQAPSGNRRKTYGRRQHELHERRQREYQPESMDMDDPALDAVADRFSFLDPRTPRLHYAIGE